MKSHDLVHEIQNTAAVFGRNKEVNVVFEGERAYTNGNEIVLPSLPGDLDFDKATSMVFRGYLDHEAGHVRHTDFEAVNKFADHNSQEAFQIWNCLEDMWLEKKVMEEYPGAEKNFRALSEAVGKLELDNVQKHDKIFKDSFNIDSVTNAILRCGRKSPFDYGGESNTTMYNSLPERLKEWGSKWIEEVHKCKNTTEIINMALAIEKLLKETNPMANPNKPENGKGESGGEGLEGDPQSFKFDPNADPNKGKPSNGKGQERIQNGKAKGDKAFTSKTQSEYAKEWIQSTTDIFMDKAKDKKLSNYRVFTTRHDEVYDRTKTPNRKHQVHSKMQKNGANDYEKIKSGLGGVVNTMKAKLRRALLAKETRDWDFAREHGRLDSKKLVAGSLGTPTIYKQRKDRLEMDTAVHLLIDLSGSMGGNKIVVAAEAAIAFAECLEGTQIKYQITGFSNGGTASDIYQKLAKDNGKYHRVEPLNLFKYKKFEESLQVAKGSVSAIKESAGGNNSDRDAVLWAAQELKTRPEKRKILFVFSDGQPCNSTHNVRYEDEYGVLTKALKEGIDTITKDGVECVGIGILTSHVEDIYPRSVTISNVKDLSGATFTQLSNLLTGGKVKL